jgi:hypothetical protein
LGSLASKATEVGNKSWGGFSNFVKSPSLQGFGAPFKSQYEGLDSPEGEKSSTQQQQQNTGGLASNYHGEMDSYSSLDDFYDKPSKEELKPKEQAPPRKKSPKPKQEREAGAVPTKPKTKSSSPKPPTTMKKEETPPLISFDLGEEAPAPSKSTAKAKAAAAQQKKEAEAKKKKEWDDDAWDLLNQ